jgi:5-methylcytosine-specific restriction endonuclease McrA
MYGTARWKRLRAIVLADQPFCTSGAVCDSDNTGNRAVSTDVHHVLGVAAHPDLQWELTNLAALCHECHSSITATTEGFAVPKSEAA